MFAHLVLEGAEALLGRIALWHFSFLTAYRFKVQSKQSASLAG